MDNNTMNKLSYGLFVLTAADGDKHNGCIINTATQITSNPNRIAIAVNKGNLTHDMIMETKKFTVSVISQQADFELFKHFGFVSGRDTDKFADFKNCKKAPNGTMIVTEGTNAYISATVLCRFDFGTHTLFVGDVTDGEILSDAPSATYEYYHNNIKPKPQPKEKTEGGKTVWRCKICGYEYEGDELPEDYICPLCKHPASDFEKVTV